MPLGVVNDAEFAAELLNSGITPVESPSDSISNLDGNAEQTVEDHRRDSNLNDSAAISGVVETIQSRGRKQGDVNTPLALQQLIGEAGISSRRDSVELATLLGVSASSASAYANGASSTATYNKPKTELFDFLNKKKKTIAKRAGVKLLSALENITDDKLSSAKVSDLAIVAKSMSGIIKDMEPPVVNQPFGANFNGPSIVMFAPPLVEESRFQSITVQE